MSSEPVPARSIDVPRQKLGRYELITELASGGMGVVYLGRLQGVGGFERMFAIKVLHKHLAAKPPIISMLLNEARLAAQIQHPNVVSTVDAEVSSSGQYYVVMEYVDGFTLCEVLDHPTLDAVRRVRFGLRVLLDAMAGLDAAHRLCNPSDGTPLGIVHRDVSPTNILVSLQGTGMIADFGIARATAAHEDLLPGVVKGTPCYMAPEQLAGAETLDARADVFSLGAVLWEVLTGEQLFYSPAGVSGTFALVQNGEIQAPSCRNSRILPALDAVCLKALERDVERRYQSVRELCEDLERVGREQNLIASAHEIPEALSSLFADQIERRRASLPAVDMTSSAQIKITAALRASAPPPLGLPLRAPANSDEQPVDAVDAAPALRGGAPVADFAMVEELPVVLPRRRRTWLLAAMLAGGLAASSAMIWFSRLDADRSERAPRPPAVSLAAPSETAAATPQPPAEAVQPVSPGGDEQRVDGDVVADLAAAPATPAAAERGRRRERTFTSTHRGRARVQPPRTARAARAASALALPPGIRPFDPAAAPALDDSADDDVLETNPYLMQR